MLSGLFVPHSLCLWAGLLQK